MRRGILIGAALTVSAVLAACSGPGRRQAPSDIVPIQPSSATAAGVQVGEIHIGRSSTGLIVHAGCEAPCVVTGLVPLPHTAWGPATLVTTGAAGGGDPQVSNVFVLDAAGAARWRFRADSWLFLRPNQPATDKTGHIFLDYNPGRYDGVIVLAMTAQGVEDFGSLPVKDEQFGLYYGGSTVDPGHTGKLQVLVAANTCDPDCASAKYVYTTYVWNGHEYAKHPGKPR